MLHWDAAQLTACGHAAFCHGPVFPETFDKEAAAKEHFVPVDAIKDFILAQPE